MTTETQNTNPFAPQGIQGNDILGDFTIRTMGDDLSSLNMSGSASNNNLSSAIPQQKTNSVNNPSEETSPFSFSSSPNASSLSAPQEIKIEATSKKTEDIQQNTSTLPAHKKEEKNKEDFYFPKLTPDTVNKVAKIEKVDQKKQAIPEKKEGGMGKFLISLLIFLILVVLLFSSYYFFMTRTKETAAQPQPEEQPAAENEAPVVINPTTEKYSSSKSNYLPIDFSKATQEDVAKSLENIIPDLGSSSKDAPIEFTVVDSNNNPVVFHIFASSLKLGLSKNILSLLGNNFSLYYFTDENKTRLGIAIEQKNASALKSALAKEETSLANQLSPLFLADKAETKINLFRDSSYNNYPIRFLNLNTQNTLSIDYTITNSQLIIGTSKDTLRKILDKKVSNVVSSSKATTQPAEPAMSTDQPAINSPILNNQTPENNQ